MAQRYKASPRGSFASQTSNLVLTTLQKLFKLLVAALTYERRLSPYRPLLFYLCVGNCYSYLSDFGLVILPQKDSNNMGVKSLQCLDSLRELFLSSLSSNQEKDNISYSSLKDYTQCIASFLKLCLGNLLTLTDLKSSNVNVNEGKIFSRVKLLYF